MFNLFNKGPKVKAGKQNNQEEKKKSAVTLTGGKGPAQQNVLAEAWKKVQKMDRKQAYTLGAVAVVALVALLSIASMGGQDAEDFAEFETRGYDLANMPFSTDEAEQYLLASKYPDMNDKGHAGLYSKAEKEDRQAEDAAAKEQAQQELGASSKASEYRPNRYYGGGGGGKAASPTQVGTLNSSNLKSAGGSGMKSTFGPQGDFSNFRNQNRGNDKFIPKGPGSGDARKALLQTAQASRAAAGLKNDKLLNAKKAMMGGNVQGSGAFLDDSGAVNLGELKGLELDTNAPISSGDLSGLDDAVKDANQKGTEEAQEEEEMEWWEQWLIDIGQQIVSGLINWGMNAAQDAAQLAQIQKAEGEAAWQKATEGYAAEMKEVSKGKFADPITLAGKDSVASLAQRTGGTWKEGQDYITYKQNGQETYLSVTSGDNGSYVISQPAADSGKSAANVRISKRDATVINNKQIMDVDNNLHGGAAQKAKQLARAQAKTQYYGGGNYGLNSSGGSLVENTQIRLKGGATTFGNMQPDGSVLVKDTYTGKIYRYVNPSGDDNGWVIGN